MNDAGGFVVFMIIFAIIAAASLSYWHWKLSLNETYRRLASRFGGTLHDTGWAKHPRVQFVHKGASVLIDVQSTRDQQSARHTQCHISWPDRAFRCEVYPEGFLARLGKLIGMQDIQIGFPPFDRSYIITGNDVRAIREFLTLGVQQRIDELREYGHHGIYLSINGGRLLIKKLGHIREYRQLERFVQMSLDLYDEAMQAATEGVEFVDDKHQATLSLAEAVCQICGEDVKFDAVFCRSCRTPHHLDCWKYYGACSTYGCGQQRYVSTRQSSSA